MAETTGSVGFAPRIPQRAPQRTPMDDLSDIYKKRQIVRQEIRKDDLVKKAKAGVLTKREALELNSYKMANALEKMAKMGESTVCYMA